MEAEEDRDREKAILKFEKDGLEGGERTLETSKRDRRYL